MKSNKHSKKNFKYSDFEKSDIGSQSIKGVRKDKSAKRRLSIYDEFEDENYDELTFNSEADDLYDEE
ncbi:MAG: hypothetical protein AB2L20_28650 [Mangrovibacterium sp.]|jgi:hypothetical protein